MIELANAILVGRGHERLVYAHPDDDSKVIKVDHGKGRDREQNKLEKIYYDFLEARDVDFSHISRCYGWVETSMGKGLIFERIINYDGAKALDLKTILEQHIISTEEILSLVKSLQAYLQDNAIVFADATFANVLFQHIDKEKWKLMIVDGLGARHLDFKFWLVRYCKWFRTYKINKQQKKLFNDFVAVSQKIENIDGNP